VWKVGGWSAGLVKPVTEMLARVKITEKAKCMNVFNSTEPNAQVSYSDHVPSVVRP